MPTNMDMMGQIVKAINQSGDLDKVSWAEFSSVFEMDDDGELAGSYGYAYDAAGIYTAVAFLTPSVASAVEAYREWLRLEGDKGFKKMLLQFNRVSFRVKAEFEFENLSRWQITPRNVDEMIAKLRPNLE